MEILQDIGNKIGFDWRLALTSLINFLIIFFLLVKFALPAIKKTIDERTAKIKEGLRLREEADKIVTQAKSEGLEITKGANKKAEEIFSKAEISSKELVSAAHEKASTIVQEAEKQKEESKAKGLLEAENILQKDIAKILTKISANAFSGKVSAEANKDFIQKVFKL
jgi:F-type H+-transporting ATPase subunit b